MIIDCTERKLTTDELNLMYVAGLTPRGSAFDEPPQLSRYDLYGTDFESGLKVHMPYVVGFPCAIKPLESDPSVYTYAYQDSIRMWAYDPDVLREMVNRLRVVEGVYPQYNKHYVKPMIDKRRYVNIVAPLTKFLLYGEALSEPVRTILSSILAEHVPLYGLLAQMPDLVKAVAKQLVVRKVSVRNVGVVAMITID